MKKIKPKQPEVLTEAQLEEIFSNTSESPLDCVAARLAFDFKKLGAAEARDSLFPDGVPEAMRQRLLKEGLQPDYSREDLLDAHDELLALGLTEPAAIALEVSALKQSRFHMLSAPWVVDSRTWEEKEQKRLKWDAERQQRLSQHR